MTQSLLMDNAPRSAGDAETPGGGPRSLLPLTTREAAATHRYLYVAPLLDATGQFVDGRLAGFSERHRLTLPDFPMTPTTDPAAGLAGSEVAGVVIGMHYGWAGRRQLWLARRALKLGRRVFFHWAREEAMECIDRERLASFWRMYLVVNATRTVRAVQRRWRMLVAKVKTWRLGFYRVLPPAAPAAAEAAVVAAAPAAASAPAEPVSFTPIEVVAGDVERLLAEAAPIAFPDPAGWLAGPKIPGLGVYLRTDYWSTLTAGGSYTHTCYVAKELAARTEQFLMLSCNRYALLDEWGLRQVTLPAISREAHENALFGMTAFLETRLRLTLEVLRPAYVYERICQCNYTGAKLCRELGIPYIVEYNGSELSMARSFAGGTPYTHEKLVEAIEDAAFRQATLITVVSEPIKHSLVARGIAPEKILVNPNGVDTDVYRPAAPEEKAEVCRELGWDESPRVIGFTGTFGAWHGIDVLAAALPQLCQRHPQARFLLIGDGVRRHLVAEQIQRHQLGRQVALVGHVPQEEGRRLLRACDIMLSPHNVHMVDSEFFGSPTKLFEYMGLGAGIVASDLMQLGQVLAPGLRAAELADSPVVAVSDQRAVLCTPGSVAELTEAVGYLIEHPAVCRALGANARRAAVDTFSWKHHVERLWHFAAHGRLSQRDLDERVFQPSPAAARAGCQPERTASPGTTDQAPAQSDSPEAAAATPDERGDQPAANAALVKKIDTGDHYKNEVQAQWDDNPCGSQYARQAQPRSLEWFLEVQAYRYGHYAPWMRETMEFAQHRGKKLLEIGAGLGTDLAQFALHGAQVTDLDLSAGHLALARENFQLRGLPGQFIHHDAESLPFDDNAFDVVYTNGVIHHTPNTRMVVDEIYRVLKPGGRVIVMVYAENSWFYWYEKVIRTGIDRGQLFQRSIGDILSDGVEQTTTGTRPLVKVYTRARLRKMFSAFDNVKIAQRQLTQQEVPSQLRWLSPELLGNWIGWNLVLKADKPIDTESRADAWSAVSTETRPDWQRARVA